MFVTYFVTMFVIGFLEFYVDFLPLYIMVQKYQMSCLSASSACSSLLVTKSHLRTCCSICCFTFPEFPLFLFCVYIYTYISLNLVVSSTVTLTIVRMLWWCHVMHCWRASCDRKVFICRFSVTINFPLFSVLQLHWHVIVVVVVVVAAAAARVQHRHRHVSVTYCYVILFKTNTVLTVQHHQIKLRQM
jgi:hypothetical protein